jgi:RHS repeat-associated protein
VRMEKAGANSSHTSATDGYYYRDYSWNERNLLSNTTDALMTKNIFLGTERIVTKQCSKDAREGFAEAGTQSEADQQYYYHADHLGSVSAITDSDGDVYERLEYTPYGEVWIDLQYGTTAFDFDTPYRFTGKELDEETGLYYYGARYLDSKYSMWISTDPALSDYMAGSKAGGGAYNPVNFNLYHYAGNNPVKYTDPDGNFAVAVVGAIVVWGFNVGLLSYGLGASRSDEYGFALRHPIIANEIGKVKTGVV